MSDSLGNLNLDLSEEFNMEELDNLDDLANLDDLGDLDNLEDNLDGETFNLEQFSQLSDEVRRGAFGMGFFSDFESRD